MIAELPYASRTGLKIFTTKAKVRNVQQSPKNGTHKTLEKVIM